jgi:hypothetical protein
MSRAAALAFFALCRDASWRSRALLAALIASASVWAHAAAPALASHGQALFFEAPRELLSAGTRSRALSALERIGVRALRVELHWHDVAPDASARRRPSFDAKDPASYQWGPYDALLGEARRLGWQLLLTVASPVPRWATAGGKDLLTRPDDLQFEEFMTAVGRRFGSEVTLWGVWNEPNLSSWLRPQWNANGTPASPRIYRGLFQAAYAGLVAAGVTTPRLLFGETAPFGVSAADLAREPAPREVAPLAFLRGALCLDGRYRKAPTCAALPVYGYAHHPYTYPAVEGPFYRPPERDQVTIGSLSRLSAALDLAARAHAIPGRVAIYLTEYGVQSTPNPLGVSLAQQAEYDAVSERIAWQDPRVAAFSQYLFRDEPAHDGLLGSRTGLYTSSGARKPLADAFALPLVVTRQRRGYSLWGLVRPAQGATSVRVAVEPPGSGGYRTLAQVRTDASGYWSLHSPVAAVRWRVSWRSPAGRLYRGPPIRAS